MLIFVAFVGCDSAQNVLTDTTRPSNAVTPDTSVQMEGTPVKLIWLINYPVGGKDAYIEWVASVSSTLSAPPELRRVASYDNIYGSVPNRLVEFEFDNFVDAMTYLNRPDIAAVFEELPRRSSAVSTYMFVQRSDYIKTSISRNVKFLYLIDYPLGEKDAYIEWVTSVVPTLSTPEEVKRIASYDNYYGESPHRLVESEFESIADLNRYTALEGVKSVYTELPNRANSAMSYIFELRGDYINLEAQ